MSLLYSVTVHTINKSKKINKSSAESQRLPVNRIILRVQLQLLTQLQYSYSTVTDTVTELDH